MSELRWTLLILGVVFILALTWWERRRPRQAFAPRLREASPPQVEVHRVASTDAAPPAEPWIGESGLSDVVLSDVALGDASASREPEVAPSRRAPGEPGPLDELPTLVVSDEDERLALEAAWNETLPEPKLIEPEAGATVELIEPAEPLEPLEPLEPVKSTAPAPAEPVLAGPPRESAPEPEVGLEPAAVGDGGARVEPLVEWPPEESRRILALRLVAPPAGRFPGRTLRLALCAEGFLLGKFSIFPTPDEQNRAVLSAASLNRPGAFDLETMDSQRYAGLSLFAVLPGAMTPAQAFEELLAAARNLNERLQGALQDERGNPLTVLRVTSLRESLRAEAATLAPASGE